MRDKVFISYAHYDQEDTDWMRKLKKHLGFFQRKDLLNIWDDSKLSVGGNIGQEIIEIIDQSKIAILLIGPAFLGSGFINDIELPRILEAARADGLQIFPLITGYCSYLKSDLKELKAFNDVSKPLESMSVHEQNEILFRFCNMLEEVYSKRHVLGSDPIVTANGQLNGLQKFIIRSKRLTSCDFTTHRNQIICSGFDPEIFNADLFNQSVESIKSVNSNARTIFRFPGSSMFLVGYDNGDVYSVNSDLVNFKKCFTCKSSIYHIGFNQINNTIITSEKSGEVSEWRVNNIAEITLEEDTPEIDFLNLITVHPSNAFMSVYSGKRDTCFSVSAAGTLASLDYKTGKVKVDNIYKNYSLYCMSVADNGLLVIGASHGKVFLITENFKRKEITIHTDTIRALAISRAGKWLFTGSKDKSVKVRNLLTDKTWILYVCNDYVYDIKFSDDYNQLLICDGSGQLLCFSFSEAIDIMGDDEMDFYVKQIK